VTLVATTTVAGITVGRITVAGIAVAGKTVARITIGRITVASGHEPNKPHISHQPPAKTPTRREKSGVGLHDQWPGNGQVTAS
jgi:hypothetical protein